MIKIEYRGLYYLLKFEDILNFDAKLDDIFYWICMIDDFLQTISSKVVVSHASFKLKGDALDW